MHSTKALREKGEGGRAINSATQRPNERAHSLRSVDLEVPTTDQPRHEPRRRPTHTRRPPHRSVQYQSFYSHARSKFQFQYPYQSYPRPLNPKSQRGSRTTSTTRLFCSFPPYLQVLTGAASKKKQKGEQKSWQKCSLLVWCVAFRCLLLVGHHMSHAGRYESMQQNREPIVTKARSFGSTRKAPGSLPRTVRSATASRMTPLAPAVPLTVAAAAVV